MSNPISTHTPSFLSPDPALLSFLKKKQNILSTLNTPISEYHDRSPKGSVDEGIRDLIDEINSIEGLVTTSSCAGRVSVYLEGEKGGEEEEEEEDLDREVGGGGGAVLEGEEDREETEQDDDDDDEGGGGGITSQSKPRKRTTAAAGGKGNGGRWLFVSHDPLPFPPPETTTSPHPYHDLFGLTPQPESQVTSPSDPVPSSRRRLIRLQFEPLLLHILCASTSHAIPPLTSAHTSGFRESGLQSLPPTQPTTKSKSQSQSQSQSQRHHHPILALRTFGLTFQSVIGYYLSPSPSSSSNGHQKPQPLEEYHSLVPESYLSLMIHEINQRFIENGKRRERFREALRTRCVVAGGKGKNADWEDKDVRAARMREEGLKRKRELNGKNSEIGNGNGVIMNTDIDLSMLGLEIL